MIRATFVDKSSAYLGEECALCKNLLSPGDEIVICPEDGTRHHVHCWQANGNRCTAYGCLGAGEIITTRETGESESPPVTRQQQERGRRSKVRVLPSSSLGCAQSCLLLSIAIAILLFAVGCFGVWAIADYIMLELLGWQYRAPLSGSLLPSDALTALASLAALIR